MLHYYIITLHNHLVLRYYDIT